VDKEAGSVWLVPVVLQVSDTYWPSAPMVKVELTCSVSLNPCHTQPKLKVG